MSEDASSPILHLTKYSPDPELIPVETENESPIVAPVGISDGVATENASAGTGIKRRSSKLKIIKVAVLDTIIETNLRYMPVKGN